MATHVQPVVPFAGVPAEEAPASSRRVAIPLRFIVPIFGALILAVGVLGSAMISERQARTLLVLEIQTRLMLEARNLGLASSGALLEGFPELTLQPIVRDLMVGHPEIVSVIVLDHKDIVKGHPANRELGKHYQQRPGALPEETSLRLRNGERLLGDARELVAISPVLHSSGQRLGTAVVVMRRSYLDQAIARARQQQWILLSVLIALGGLSALALMTLLMRPVGGLQRGLERIGQGDLDTPLALGTFTEINRLAETVNWMTARLRHAHREAVERERLDSEVALAKRIQTALLPPGPLRVGPVSMAARHCSAAEVGGDYVDMFPLGDGCVGVAIADVSGKGVAGCLVMAMLASLLRALRENHSSPAAMVVELEQQLQRSLQRSSFVTLCYAIVDPSTGKTRFASAGHLPMLVLRRATGSAEWIRSKAVPIGALRNGTLAKTLHDGTLQLESGDTLVQLTDGFSEAMHPESGEQFGFERVEAVVRGFAGEGPERVIERLYEAVGEWTRLETPEDDQTLLVLQYCGAESSTAPVLVGVQHPAAHPALEAMALLERARSGGGAMKLQPGPDPMPSLRQWLSGVPQVSALVPHDQHLVESALYEAAMNVLEHGYRGRQDAQLEILWSPVPGSASIEDGCFVLRDQAHPYDPTQRSSPDFSDVAVRRRGRGLGVEMIRRIMAEVRYEASTPQGNLLVMRFVPTRGRAA